ncbi:hypothetical protein ACQUJO_12340 [Ralstonia pseudosolanacearum]
MMWTRSNTVHLQAVRQTFTNCGITPAIPGFYDSEPFLRAERNDSNFLENYAHYVRYREYEQQYLASASERIVLAAEEVSSQLAADGRLGLCVNASSLLSRLLDRMGIWNYVAKAGVVINFPEHSRLDPLYFYSFDIGHFQAPHAIVVAPPFDVVDVSLKYQAFDEGQGAHIPGCIVASATPTNWTSEELFSPLVRAQLRRHRVDPLNALRRESPKIAANLDRFGAVEIEAGACSVKYLTVAFYASEEPLEELMPINGLTGGAMLERVNLQCPRDA